MQTLLIVSITQNVVCRPIANMPRLSFSFTLQRRCKFDSTTCTLNQCICFLRMLSSIVSLFCISYLNLESRQNRTNLPTQNRYGIISFFSTFLFDYFCFVVIALVWLNRVCRMCNWCLCRSVCVCMCVCCCTAAYTIRDERRNNVHFLLLVIIDRVAPN